MPCTTSLSPQTAGERPEPALGEFREGVVMTRYFWQVVLENAGGMLTEVEELAAPRQE